MRFFLIPLFQIFFLSNCLSYKDSLLIEEPYLKAKFPFLNQYEFNRKVNTVNKINEVFYRIISKKEKRSELFLNKDIKIKLNIGENGLIKDYQLTGDSLSTKQLKLIKRFVNSIGKFIPATLNGKRVPFIYPISFAEKDNMLVIVRDNFEVTFPETNRPQIDSLFSFNHIFGVDLNRQFSNVFFYHQQDFTPGIYYWYIKVNKNCKLSSFHEPSSLDVDFSKILHDTKLKLSSAPLINGVPYDYIYKFTIKIGIADLDLNKRTLAGYEIGN